MSHLLQVDDLGFGYGAEALFRGVTFSLSAGDRMALVAPNGAGKSTLLRLLAGELAPDRGRVVRRGGATVGYFRQSHELDARAADTTVEQALTGPHDDPLTLANRLGIKDLDRTLASLSGGERSRVGLGAVLAREPDLLLLDEPTNHLDIPACEILEQALATGYEGTLIVVSHDRQFLETVTNRLIVVRDGRAEVLPGGFRERSDQGARESARPRSTSQPRSPARTAEPCRAPARPVLAGEGACSERRREELERAIGVAEGEIAAMRAELAADPGGDWAAIAQKAERERAASRKLESMLLEWTSLAGSPQ